MTLTINLNPELEAQLREEVAKSGSDASTLVILALEEHLQRKSQPSQPAHLSREEAVLLQKINQGLPEKVWQEYRNLIAKRRAESLTSEEHARLIALSDSISDAHSERIGHVAELARLRRMPLEAVMKQLGIKPRKV